MASWQDVEPILWAWLRDANEPAWLDLENAWETMDYLEAPVPHRCLVDAARRLGIEDPPPLCDTCNNRMEAALFLEERAAETAEDVRPELRLAAANSSALKSRGW
jgi:hypothetical protein